MDETLANSRTKSAWWTFSWDSCKQFWLVAPFSLDVAQPLAASLFLLGYERKIKIHIVPGAGNFRQMDIIWLGFSVNYQYQSINMARNRNNSPSVSATSRTRSTKYFKRSVELNEYSVDFPRKMKQENIVTPRSQKLPLQAQQNIVSQKLCYRAISHHFALYYGFEYFRWHISVELLRARINGWKSGHFSK